MTFRSCVFITTPTSGTGSLWRIITALTKKQATLHKISEEYANQGNLNALTDWKPELSGFVYMYNTPHIANPHIAASDVRIIVNFRDPRDLACNQYHWAQQHPSTDKTQEQLEEYRAKVKNKGIDQFVIEGDNNVHLKEFQTLKNRLRSDDENTLIVSYNQLCLGFDEMVERMANFFGVALTEIPYDVIDRERTVNLTTNVDWIGQMWTGTDIMPGRYRNELRPDTIKKIDDKYRDMLAFFRALEQPQFRIFLATARERDEMSRVLVGKNNRLFLTNDANDVIGQITGKCPLSDSDLFRCAFAHSDRRIFGEMVGHFRYEHAVIPNKEVVHRDSLPDHLKFEEHGPRPIRQYLESPASTIWRPFYDPTVLQGDTTTKLFADTDSHWTHAGALRYFNAFLQMRFPHLKGVFDDVPLRRFKAFQKCDLALKLEMPPEEVEIVAPQRSNARLAFENAITNEGCIRWFVNEKSSAQERAFIMHDSFTLWLLGIVPELFSEVIFFHGTVFDFEFIRAYNPSVVICLQVERFFVRQPETGGSMFQFIDRHEEEKGAKSRFHDFWLKSRYATTGSRGL